MLHSVSTLTLSTLPFLYTSSPPPNIFRDYIITIMFKMYTVQCTLYIHVYAYNSHSLIMGQPIKTTYSG